MSGLVFWVSELILWVFESGRVGRPGRAGRAAGSGAFNIWGKIHFGNLYLKKFGRKSGHFSKGSLYMGRKSVHFSKRVLIYGS